MNNAAVAVLAFIVGALVGWFIPHTGEFLLCELKSGQPAGEPSSWISTPLGHEAECAANWKQHNPG